MCCRKDRKLGSKQKAVLCIILSEICFAMVFVAIAKRKHLDLVTELTDADQKNIVGFTKWVTTGSSILGLIGALYVIFHISLKHDTVVCRLQLLRLSSMCDALNCLWMSFGMYFYDNDYMGLCNIQAIVNDLFALLSCWMTLSITLHATLRIGWGYEAKKVEKFVWRFVRCGVTTISVVVLVYIGMDRDETWAFGDAGLWCWIEDSQKDGYWLLFYLPLWVILLVSLLCFIVLAARSYVLFKDGHSKHPIKKIALHVFWSTILYQIVEILHYIPSTINRSLPQYGWLPAQSLWHPSVGFLTAIVYHFCDSPNISDKKGLSALKLIENQARLSELEHFSQFVEKLEDFIKTNCEDLLLPTQNLCSELRTIKANFIDKLMLQNVTEDDIMFRWTNIRIFQNDEFSDIQKLGDGECSIVYSADVVERGQERRVVCKVCKTFGALGTASLTDFGELAALEKIGKSKHVIDLLGMCLHFTVPNTEVPDIICLVFPYRGLSLLQHLQTRPQQQRDQDEAKWLKVFKQYGLRITKNDKNRLASRLVSLKLPFHLEGINLKAYDLRDSELKSLIYIQSSQMNKILSITIQMAEAIKETHENGVIHRDIALRNFLYDEGKVILIDFGLARFSTDGAYQLRKSKKFFWKSFAPELLAMGNGLVFTTRTDIWALGLSFYHLLQPHNEPFSNFETHGDLCAYFSGRKEDVLISRGQFLSDVIDRCCAFDPRDRPSAAGVVEMLNRESEKSQFFNTSNVIGGHIPMKKKSRKCYVSDFTRRPSEVQIKSRKCYVSDFTRRPSEVQIK